MPFRLRISTAMFRAAFLCFVALAGLAAMPALAETDPYAPLHLYSGSWQVNTPGSATPTRLENHCGREGALFTCEQVVAGRTAALVVFEAEAVDAQPDGSHTYRTQVMGETSDAPGGWNRLTIMGHRWVFEPEDDGASTAAAERTVNVFLDDDHIHFEVQHATDGGAWLTKASGDEQRVR
jgi:hypothetical protein